LLKYIVEQIVAATLEFDCWVLGNVRLHL